jgi:hypothetical protein
MNAERRRQLKAVGKAEVERRSAELRAAVTASNPAPIGSDEWVRGYRAGTQRERWLRSKLPVLHRDALETAFLVSRDVGAGWIPHVGGYVRCLRCGSAAPSALPRRWFYWAGCACGNVRWRCVLFWRRGVVADPESVEPVKLIGRG